MIEDEIEMKRLTLEQIEKALEELERDGLVRKTGEFRNGKPVYTATIAPHLWGGTA